MALAASLGIEIGIIVFLGVSIAECNTALLSGSYFGMSGILWVILLLMNYEKMIKK